MAFTQIVACQFLQTDSGVLLRDSTPQEFLTASPKAALEFLTEEREHVLRVLWDLDSEVAPLLKLLGKDFCQTLHDKGEAILRPYRVKYIPNKLFSIMNMDMGYLAEFYNLSQFLPTYPAPDSLEQLYYWGRMVHKTFHDIGMEATRMVSPANIFDSNVLDRLNVPTWRDLPPEICEYAMFCSKRQWIEAVQLGYWPETFDYDLSSAYSSRMINLVDSRYCDWFTYKDHIPSNAVYGYFNCEVSIPRSVKLHPIITYVNNIPTTPTGDHLQMYLSLDRINFIAKHNLGQVKIIDGYYALMKSPELLDAEKHPMTYPLRIIIPRLLSKRSTYNPVKDLLVKLGCFSEDTSIWTFNKGIITVDKLEEGDLVYSINPISLKGEIKPVIGIQKYPYKGQPICHSANNRHDFLVSPEHLFLVTSPWMSHYQTKPISSFPRGRTNHLPKFGKISGKRQPFIDLWKYLPNSNVIGIIGNRKQAHIFESRKEFKWTESCTYLTTKEHIIPTWRDFEKQYNCKIFMKNEYKSKYLPFVFRVDDFLSLMGWYLSEGNLYADKKTKNKRICIVNTDIIPIMFLLERMNIPYSYYKSPKATAACLTFSHNCIWNCFMNECKSGAFNKVIPDWVFQLDHEHLTHLFESMMLGDGSWGRNTKTGKDSQMVKYTTVSKTLAESFQRLCIHLGYKTHIVLEPRHGNAQDCYRVFIHDPRPYTWIGPDITKTTYDGDYIYGVNVADNHTILAGRNSKWEYVGQCNSIGGKWQSIVERKGEEVLGDHANPVWSEKIVTATCLDVADFIYRHQLTDNVLHISIDGFLSDKPVLLMSNDTEIGWKEPYIGPALIISSGRLFLGKKRPGGLTLETALDLINSDPDNVMWQTTADRKVTLAEALKNNTFDQLGQPITTGQTLHLLASHKRHFPKTPTSGRQLLAEHFPSIPFHLKSNKEEG